MKPKSALNESFPIDGAAQEALREHQLCEALRSVDGAFATFPISEPGSIIAAKLAALTFNVDLLPDMVNRGEIKDSRISPPYDAFQADDMPGSILVTRCQRVTVAPRPPLFRRRSKTPGMGTDYTYYNLDYSRIWSSITWPNRPLLTKMRRPSPPS